MQAKAISEDDKINTEPIQDLICEVIKIAKTRNEISKDAYVRCEITFDSAYNNRLLELSILDRNEENELVEYVYTKQNGETLSETLRAGTEYDEEFGGNLLLSDYEILISNINSLSLNHDENDSYFLTVRDYKPGRYLQDENNQAFEVLKNEIRKIDTLDERIGISIKGKNEVSVVLKK
ncbi:MAG: hypothetical protein Q4F05_10235 [bacterium]|nr:hypothetical protein [bacterium]